MCPSSTARQYRYRRVTIVAGPPGLKGGDAADWEPHQDLLDDGMVEFVFGGFLVRGAGDRVMLVDGGVGAEPDPQYGLSGGELPPSLASVGVTPDEVTDVLHAPPLRPHRLGVDRRRADVPERDLPLRPARLGSLRGFRRLRDRAAPTGRGPLRALGRRRVARRRAPLCQTHARESALVVLSSGDQRRFLAGGDVVHCAVELLDDEWAGVADVDPVMAQQARNALARELEGTDVPVAAAHFPGLKFGRVLAGQGRRQWVFDWDQRRASTAGYPAPQRSSWLSGPAFAGARAEREGTSWDGSTARSRSSPAPARDWRGDRAAVRRRGRADDPRRRAR